MSATTVLAHPNDLARTPRVSAARIVAFWTVLSLIAFPLFGLIGWKVGGHVDGVLPALVGGVITGAGVGFMQWLFLRRDLDMGLVWVPVTGVALAVGLAIGSAVVDYGTAVGELMIMGAISGAAVGIAQGLLLRDKFSLWHVWMVAMPALWALAWFVSNSIGVNVDEQFTVFGASGTLVFGILSGLLLTVGDRSQAPVA